MEKYTMFMDWKNQCSENEYTTPRLFGNRIEVAHVVGKDKGCVFTTQV